MQIYRLRRAETLSKDGVFYKMLRGLLVILPVLLTILCAESGLASGIPVTLTWFQSQGKAKYTLEISDDAKFGTLLLKTEVQGSQFVWQAPKEGTYHWRVTPVSTPQPGDKAGVVVEVSSVASGSFVALSGEASPGAPVALRWSQDNLVTAYYLRIQENGVESRMIVSLTPNYSLPRSSRPLVVVVEPRRGSNSNKVARNAVSHFDPNLQIVPAETAPATPAPQREVLVGDQEPRTIVPLPPPPAAIELKGSEREEILLLPENRVIELILAIYAGNEKTYATKGSLASRYSKSSVSGGMLTYRAIPYPGLHVHAEATAHGREASWRDQNGADVVAQPVSNFMASGGIGWDLFYRNPNRRHQLVVDVRGALSQGYHLPTQPEDLNSLKLKRTDLQLWGGGAWYRWSARQWGAGASVSSMIQTVDRSLTNDATMDEWSAFVSADPKPYMTVTTGVISRLTTVKRCATEVSACAADGVAASRSSLVAGYVGIGYVLY